MDLSCSKSSLRYSSAVLFLHRTSSNNPNIANNRSGQIFELDWNINFYFTNFSTKWFFFILLKWTLFDSTKFTGYPKWVIHRRMGRSQRVANKISGNIFVIQISSATKLTKDTWWKINVVVEVCAFLRSRAGHRFKLFWPIQPPHNHAPQPTHPSSPTSKPPQPTSPT